MSISDQYSPIDDVACREEYVELAKNCGCSDEWIENSIRLFRDEMIALGAEPFPWNELPLPIFLHI